MARQGRSDAARNRQILLNSAHTVFAEHGTADVSLNDVARHAGLGVGTVYRHFPTRGALLEAVLTERFESLRALAADLRAAPSPDAALADWLEAFVAHLTEYRGLAAMVMPSLHDETSALSVSCRGMRRDAAELLERAQREGTIREDLTLPVLLRLANAVALTVDQVPEKVEAMLSFLLDGLRRR
jgi:AcrR family transcriptional regulator